MAANPRDEHDRPPRQASDGAPDASSHQAICEALFEGRKIEAIRRHREATGSDLRGAKEAVEALEAELRASDPTRFLAPPRAGCLGAIALTFTLLAVGYGLVA